MAYSDDELIKLDRDQVLALSRKERIHWFKLLQARHREMDLVTNDLAHLLHADNETRIITLIGMTGIGKTTLATRIINNLTQKCWSAEIEASDVPYIFVAAPANGEKSLSWRTLYQRALTNADECLVKHKRQIKAADRETIVVSAEGTLAGLRESLESMLKNRNVRLLAIDEAVHLLRFEGYAAVMDTLKSIASVHLTKILLIGSYDLFDLVTDYGQVVRRGEILHYKRYHLDCEKDMTEFHETVKKLQLKWPCKIVPNFAAISRELCEVTLGSIGLLKALMLNVLQSQIASKGEIWNPAYLKKAAKSAKLLAKIRSETELGEEKLTGATFGDSWFAEKAVFDRLVAKMAA